VFLLLQIQVAVVEAVEDLAQALTTVVLVVQVA
jgi:hypothetical protein